MEISEPEALQGHVGHLLVCKAWAVLALMETEESNDQEQ